MGSAMTLFDLLLILIILASVGFAFIRGGLKELATLVAIAIAAGMAWVLSKPILQAIGKAESFFGTIAVIGILSVVVFIGVYFGFHLLLRRVDLTGPAALANKAGGGLFGLLRALVLIGLGFLGYSYYLDADRWPDSINDAALLPIAKSSAAFFENFGIKEAEASPAQPADPADTSDGYSSNERNNLSELVATVTTSEDQPAPTKPSSIAEIISEEKAQGN